MFFDSNLTFQAGPIKEKMAFRRYKSVIFGVFKGFGDFSIQLLHDPITETGSVLQGIERRFSKY